MITQNKVRYAYSPQDVKNHDTSQLRKEFLIDNLMALNAVNIVYSHYDRFITGSVVPAKSPLKL